MRRRRTVRVDGVYTFATDGPRGALAQARELSEDRDVAIMGGAEAVREFLAAGLVDEVSLHVVPVLFGTGTPLLGGHEGPHIELELIEAIATNPAVHARYRVVNKA